MESVVLGLGLVTGGYPGAITWDPFYKLLIFFCLLVVALGGVVLFCLIMFFETGFLCVTALDSLKLAL